MKKMQPLVSKKHDFDHRDESLLVVFEKLRQTTFRCRDQIILSSIENSSTSPIFSIETFKKCQACSYGEIRVCITKYICKNSTLWTS